MKVLIGQTGTVGNYIWQHHAREFHCWHRHDERLNRTQTCEHIIIAAPSGDRRWVRQNPKQDTRDVDDIISAINHVSAQRVTLISTIDTVQLPFTAYGNNRLRLEQFVQQRFANWQIVRLGGLIAPSIKKNVLFDLRNQCYLDSINLDSVCQWTPLDTVWEIIEDTNSRTVNLVSEPVSVRHIVQRFRPELLSKVGANASDQEIYDVRPYWFTLEQVLDAMRVYLS